MSSHFILTFPSTHAALKAERIAKAAGIEVAMIPVPRSLSADCNMGLRVGDSDHDRLLTVLAKNNVIFKSHQEQ